MNLSLRFKRAYNTFKSDKTETLTIPLAVKKHQFIYGFTLFFSNLNACYKGTLCWSELNGYNSNTKNAPWNIYNIRYIDEPDFRLKNKWYEIHVPSGEKEYDQEDDWWYEIYRYSHQEWISEDRVIYVV